MKQELKTKSSESIFLITEDFISDEYASKYVGKVSGDINGCDVIVVGGKWLEVLRSQIGVHSLILNCQKL